MRRGRATDGDGTVVGRPRKTACGFRFTFVRVSSHLAAELFASTFGPAAAGRAVDASRAMANRVISGGQALGPGRDGRRPGSGARPCPQRAAPTDPHAPWAVNGQFQRSGPRIWPREPRLGVRPADVPA